MCAVKGKMSMEPWWMCLRIELKSSISKISGNVYKNDYLATVKWSSLAPLLARLIRHLEHLHSVI